MGRVVVWKRDIDSEIKKLYKCTTLPDINGYNVALELSDQILDVLEKENDYRTPALMVEDAQEACEDTCKEITKILKDLDKICDRKPKDFVDKEVRSVKISIDGTVKKLGINLKDVPKARWDKWIKTKKQYKDYKWDCAGKVALGTLGAVGSGLALAAAVPTGGATLALGIVGAAKSGLELFKIGTKMWIEAETVQKKVLFSIGALRKIYGNAQGKSNKGGAKESGLSVLNAILPLELGPTISVLKSDTELWSNKLAGIDISADKKTKAAMKLLKDADELEKLLNKSKSKDAGKIFDKLKKLRAEIDKALVACTNESARVRDGRKALEPIESKVLPELKSRQPKWTEIFDKALPAVVNLSLAAGNAAIGFKEASSALEYFHEALDLANEILAEVKELTE